MANLGVEEGNLCDKVCSNDFQCHWERLEQQTRYMFPDGTTQTCVGAQVRCGCTLSMQLISYITYEHPQAVSLTFLFGVTLAVYLFLRWYVLKHTSSMFCCSSAAPVYKPPIMLPAPRDVAISALRLNSGLVASSLENSLSSAGTVERSIYAAYLDKPPAYSNVVQVEDEVRPYDKTPPPSYAECVDGINHI